MFVPVLKYLSIIGLWKPKTDSTAYNIFGALYIFMFSVLFTFFMILYMCYLTDITELTFAIWMTLVQLCGCIKFINFFARNRNIQQLERIVNDFQLESKEEYDYVANGIKWFSRMAFFYWTMGMFAIQSTVLLALLGDQPRLPYGGVYPFLDWRSSTRDFVIVLCYQEFSLTTSSSLIMVTDIYLSFILYMISVRLDLVGRRFEKLGYGVVKCEQENLDKMQKYMEIYQVTIQFKEKVEQIFTFPFFCQIAVSAVIISSIITEVSRVSITFLLTHIYFVN